MLSQVPTLNTTSVINLYLDRRRDWLAPRRCMRPPGPAEKMSAAGPQ
jgi:hypothetical protein